MFKGKVVFVLPSKDSEMSRKTEMVFKPLSLLSNSLFKEGMTWSTLESSPHELDKHASYPPSLLSFTKFVQDYLLLARNLRRASTAANQQSM